MQPNAPQQTIQQTPPPDEIGIKDLIRELRLWKSLIRKHWYWLLIAGLLGGALGYFYASKDIPLYHAKTRFMLKNEGVGSLFGGQMSSLTGLLGGGQMGTPLERTAEVIASDRIVGRALLKEVVIDDKIDLVINHFIRLSNLSKVWVRDSLLKNVSFNKADNQIDLLNLAQRKAFKQVMGLMVPEKGSGVVRKAFDKRSGVLTVVCVHKNESFAIALCNKIYEELSSFFVEQMTYTSENNAEVMRRKLDSIQRQLNYVRREYARQTDQSLGLLLQQDKVELKSLSVKEQMLTVMYAEAVKNYESFAFMNSAAMPSLTLIDYPYSPIKPLRKNKILYTSTIAIGLSLLLLIIHRIYYFLNKYS